MTNPYQPPTATSVRASLVRRGGALLFIIGMACALLSAAVSSFVVPQFSQTFDAFGANLPLLTQWVLSYHSAIWLLPALVLVARFLWPAPLHRPLASCLVGILGLVLLMPLMFYALYRPIYQLAGSI